MMSLSPITRTEQATHTKKEKGEEEVKVNQINKGRLNVMLPVSCVLSLTVLSTYDGKLFKSTKKLIYIHGTQSQLMPGLYFPLFFPWCVHTGSRLNYEAIILHEQHIDWYLKAVLSLPIQKIDTQVTLQASDLSKQPTSLKVFFQASTTSIQLLFGKREGPFARNFWEVEVGKLPLQVLV